MATSRVGPPTLLYGDVTPDEHGVLYLDTSGANPRLKVQWQDGGLGNAPVSIVDGLATQTLAYADGTVPGGNSVSNTASETAFASSYTIPANRLAVGSVVRVRLYGTYTTAALAPTLEVRVKVGGTAVIDTGALTTAAGLGSQMGWSAEALLVVATAGVGGTMEAQGFCEFSTAATTAMDVNVPNTSAAAIDTTASKAITVTVQWSAADAANRIVLRQMVVEVLSL